MSNYFLIDGYWKDDGNEFTSHLVKETDDYDGGNDDHVFFYGLSEEDIIEAIQEGKNNSLEFVITRYTRARLDS